MPSQNVGYYIRDSSLRLDNPEYSLILQEIANNQSINQIIISERWDQRGFDPAEIGALVETFQSAGKQVFITDGVPNFSFDPRLCKYEGICQESQTRFDAQYSEYLPGIVELTNRYPSVGLISTTSFFCDDATCSMTNGSELLYRDDNHLNISGSRYVGKKILESGVLTLSK